MLTPLKHLHPKCESKEDAFKGDKSLLSEVNFLLLPFFALSRQDAYQKKGMEYRRKITPDGKPREAVWKVSARSEYGYPGPFDKKVYKSVEELLGKQGYPIKNPVIFSLYELCRFMGKEKIGGSDYKEVKESLERIKFTGIKSEGAFYHKGKKKWISKSFNLYSDIIFKGQQFGDGQIAESNLLYLSQLYLESLNARYVKPIDFGYYQSLNSNIARRLYELLGVKFYGILQMGYSHVRYNYSTLCQLLPLTRHNYPSYVKRQLEPAHQELKETDFLSEVVWEESSNGQRDWLIHYYPGPRAKREVEKFGTPYSEGITVERKSEQVIAQPLLLEEKENQLTEKLVKLGITRSVAENLVENSDERYIEEWIEAVQYVNPDDKPAYVVKAIREGWELPGGYKKEVRRRKRERQQQKSFEEEMRRQEEEREEWKSKSVEEKVEISLDRWLMMKEGLGRKPAQEEVESKRRELIEEYRLQAESDQSTS